MLRRLTVALFLIASPGFADENNLIPVSKKVEMTVGQSMIVSGFRGECGKRPGNVDPNRTRDTKLGSLSVGKWGVMKSINCGGITPAIEVIFTAQRRGRETIDVNGNKIRVRVK